MSNNIRILVFSLLLLSFFSSCGQSKPSNNKIYTVDSTIISEIDKKIAPFKGNANASISFVMYENEKAIIHDDNTSGLSFTSFSKNIVAIDCLNGTNDGFGFFLMLGKDTSFIKLKVLSRTDSDLFKESKESALAPEVLVKCVSNKVVLPADPSFVQGEVIQGFVQLESEYFYEVRNGKERKVKFKIEAFFKSEPVPVTNNQYKTLVR